MIMTAVLCAFSMKHHGEQLELIAESWTINNGIIDFPQDEYERFKDHYNHWLADLYNHNCNAPNEENNQAHSVVDALAEHKEQLFDLESQWNGSASIGETLAPSHVPTNTQALSATDTLLQQLVQQVAALSARPVQVPIAAPVAAVGPPPRAPQIRTGSSATSSCNTTYTGTLRQWDKYCYRFGVNLNHDTPECTFVNMPADKHGATKDSPFGGNIKRNHLWMKWCDPVTYKVHDVRE